jgi:glycosyltransferase involved in cell wall biosynthesis
VTPWCTILVPIYNGAKYLPALLLSLAPAIDAGCALLLLDDCSTDGSFEIAASCEFSDKSVLRNPRNIGLFATLNRGLSVVASDYVLLIFQDDIMNADYIRYMKPLAGSFPEASFLWPEIDDIDDNGAVIRQGLDTGRVEVIQPGSKPWRDVLYSGTVWTISGSLSKTEKLRHYGFRPDLPHLGDYDFLLRAIRRDIFVYLEKPLMRVRIHRGQASFRHGRQSIDLKESVSVYKEQRTRFPEEFDIATRCRVLGRTGYRIARRSAGQAARGRPRQAVATLGLLPKLASSLLR